MVCVYLLVLDDFPLELYVFSVLVKVDVDSIAGITNCCMRPNIVASHRNIHILSSSKGDSDITTFFLF